MTSRLVSSAVNLLPYPRSLKFSRGTFTLPKEIADWISRRTCAPCTTFSVPAEHKTFSLAKISTDQASIVTREHASASEFYTLTISEKGVEIQFCETAGLRAATATLRQLLRQFGRKLPYLKIQDWPDFARRGVMLDVSRGRVPRLETLLDLAEKLADFKINELQLYTEHTFAYRKYPGVWRTWGALTPREIRLLDTRCRELGIDLVPNQNSFGHLQEFLAHPKLKPLAEVPAPYEDDTGEFVRPPTTLAPNHPETLSFLRGLYDELLPNFSSRFFNVGCDETWDLGRGQSKTICKRLGQGRVYLNFLKKIHREVSRRGKTMMFWGDIILKYPELISQLPRNVVALNWGYEADHPFMREAAQFANAGVAFYVCPGTSAWQTLIGRHDNALANLRAAARAGKKFGAVGFLICDWGDGGHPQPLAVSWPMLATGAALAWNSEHFAPRELAPVLGRDIFNNPTIATAACKLGFVHRKLGVRAPNETPLGTVIAAPPPERRELFCRNGLKWFSKISAPKVRATFREIEKLRAVLRRQVLDCGSLLPLSMGDGCSKAAEDRRSPRRDRVILALELDLAARMAAQSCHFMLWLQAVAKGNSRQANKLARIGIRELKQLQDDFNAYWPLRNKAAPQHCSAFIGWRIADYRRGFVQ